MHGVSSRDNVVLHKLSVLHIVTPVHTQRDCNNNHCQPVYKSRKVLNPSDVFHDHNKLKV